MVERHIEKIILAVCVLLLVYAVFHWGFSSPLVIEVITGSRGRVESAPPDKADPVLLKAAEEIENRSMADRSPPPSPVPDYAGQLRRLQSPSVPPVQIVISLPPPLPLPGDPNTPLDLAKMGMKEIEAIIPKPGKPQVMVDREFTQKDPEPVDVLTSHVAATFNWGELVKRLNKALEQTAIFPEVVVVRVEAQIRERRLDGDWGPERVVTMTRIPQTDRDGSEITPPTVPEFDGNNFDEVNGAISDLKEQWQESILQPDYWNIWWTTQEWNTWLIHLPPNPISERIEKEREEEEEAEKAAERAADRSARAPTQRRTGRATRDRRTRGRSREEAEYAEMARREMEAQERFAEEMERRARGDRGRGRRDTGRGPRDRRILRRDSARAPTDVPPPKVPEITPLQEQLEDGLLLFWFHHTELEGLKEYQYRVRLVLVNPLITYSGNVKNDDDAKQPVVASPWSDWSVPFSAPQMTEFFAISPMGSRRAVRVEVFTRGRGQWVKKSFLVAEGEMIGGTRSVRVPNPEDGTLESEDMDFSTGAVAVRLDFNKTVKRRKISVKTVEMVYMDAKGRLKTRVAAADKASPRYKQLKEEVSRAKAAALAAVGYGR